MKPEMANAELRLAEARRLTQLMESKPNFSVLRLGDGDLRWILRVQAGERAVTAQYNEGMPPSVESNISVSGMSLRPEHYERLMRAYGNCDYLDFYESANKRYAMELHLERAPGTFRNPGPETSQIFYDWTYHEFRDFSSRHRILIAGAEAPLLGELVKDARYLKIAERFWPKGFDAAFVRVRDNGRYYWESLDNIKADLAEAIARTGADTLFLSLATGAKILCYELAKDLGIRTFDFGSMCRGLAYAGSPGYHCVRGSHFSFFVRVPLQVYMPAVERAYPDLSLMELVSKCHAQMCFDLSERVPMGSLSYLEANASSMKLDEQRKRDFRESYRYYKKKYVPRARDDRDALWCMRDFRIWCRKRGVGLDGKVFLFLVRLKRSLKAPFAHLTASKPRLLAAGAGAEASPLGEASFNAPARNRTDVPRPPQ